MDEQQSWRKKDTFKEACQHAWRGVGLGWRAERNTRIQFVVAAVALLLAVLLRLPGIQVVIVLLVSLMVIVLEMINTVIEGLGDVVQPEYDEAVGRIKDIAAGTVLMASLAAILIGLVLFVPPLVALLGRLGL